ncbi:hypothetical protein ABZ552_16330 [Nocardia sp. NPDC019219]|uniref:hypothetical protein n=1 Tax=Nocardia sp. NPDC019219 TaxID=3154590 RepID=UPI00340D1A06
MGVPINRPGRGMAPDKLHMLIALPHLDTDVDPGNLAEGVAAAKEAMVRVYGDRHAPPCANSRWNWTGHRCWKPHGRRACAWTTSGF